MGPENEMGGPLQQPDLHSDPDRDTRLALSAVTAIQRLIEERNSLRSQIATQDHELARLRRNLSLIRETYRRLTCEFVRQLQHIDSVIGDIRAPDSAKPAAPSAIRQASEGLPLASDPPCDH